MNLTKCKNNHYYDGTKFTSCPHCINEENAPHFSGILGLRQKKIATKAPLPSEEVTYPSLHHNTVGWLVCLKGVMRGESFPIREGENHIGRSSNMDIVLFKEASVSRENHAIITFSPKDNNFILAAPDYPAALFLNNSPLKQASPLSAKDRIQLGSCLLLFVPLCNETFNWNNYQ